MCSSTGCYDSLMLSLDFVWLEALAGVWFGNLLQVFFLLCILSLTAQVCAHLILYQASLCFHKVLAGKYGVMLLVVSIDISFFWPDTSSVLTMRFSLSQYMNEVCNPQLQLLL